MGYQLENHIKTILRNIVSSTSYLHRKKLDVLFKFIVKKRINLRPHYTLKSEHTLLELNSIRGKMSERTLL